MPLIPRFVLFAAAALAFALAAPSFAQTVVAPPTAPTPMAPQPVGGIKGPTITSSYPTPLPALQGVRLQPVTIVTMPDLGSRAVRMTRAQRKAMHLMSGRMGEQAEIAGTPAEVYDQVTLLYQRRTADSQRLGSDRTLQRVRLRVPIGR